MTDKRKMQPDDLMSLRFLNGGAISPDGGNVIYTVSQIDAQADKEFTTLYLRDLATGETRQMTSGKAVDSGATYSPDGKTIAFKIRPRWQGATLSAAR